jgi:hypothetical protein
VRLIATLFLFLMSCPLWVLGQTPSADDINRQIFRTWNLPIFNLVCDDRTTVSSFVNGELRSQHVYEASVASAVLREENGIIVGPRPMRVIDVNSGYREVLSIDGKPVPEGSRSMTIGGLGSVAGFLFGRPYFNVKTSGMETLSDKSGAKLILEFERKQGMEAPWFTPDFGKAWIDTESMRIARVEIRDRDLTPMLSQDAERFIVDDFGSFNIDGEQRWLVKTTTIDHFPNKAIRNFTRTHSEFSNCRRFDVSSTIKPIQ